MKLLTRVRMPLLLLVLLGSLLLATSAFAAAPVAVKSPKKMIFSDYGASGMGCAERYGAGAVSLPPVEQ